MKLLLEGSLSETLMLKDLLIGVFQAEAPGLSILKLSTADNNDYGELYFLGGHYVVGAKLNDEILLIGSEALHKLLQLTQATFCYYACDSLESLPQDSTLKIDLKQLIDDLQIIKPISSEQLLDKIFDTGPAANPGAKISLTGDQALIKGVDSTQHTSEQNFVQKNIELDWNLVEPLVVGGAPGSDDRSPGNVWNENLYTTQGLRLLSAEGDWQRKLRGLVLIMVMFLIALIVLLSCAWILMNSPSSEVSSRRYSISTLRRHRAKESATEHHPAHRGSLPH